MIAFARMQMVQRSQGGSATHKGAYNSRDEVLDERTGERHDYSDREAPVHHEVLLPEAGPAYFENVGFLWNAAEAAEGRKDSQVAREMVLALPADAKITHADRVALARSFALEHFVSKGLAVQLDIHAPEEDALESDEANWHAHLLITTRRLGPEGLDRLKARDLDPVVRRIGGCGRVVEANPWGEVWRAHQERFCREQGHDLRVDPNGLISEIHLGPRRMRRAMSEPVLRLEERRKANREATYDIGQVLDALTRYNAIFTEHDLDRLLVKQLGKEASDEIAVVRAMALASPDLEVLLDPDTGEPSGRYTTREVREEEQAVIATADALSECKTGMVLAEDARRVKAHASLRRDQEDAFDYATGAGHLKLIAGRAGTGKSYTLSAIRKAHEGEGKRGKQVIGLAPTNAVAQDMKADGFSDAATVYSALFRLNNGRLRWGPNTVVMVDEAAMLSTPIMAELLGHANQGGAKLILVGDDRQLASIERGGLFPELLQRHEHGELTEVVRQRVDWQRAAARDLAEYRFAEAVDAFDRAGAISWNDTKQETMDALVAAWAEDSAAHPDESRFVFAYTNKDVDGLNDALRHVRAKRGELGEDVTLMVSYREPQEGEEEELHEVQFAVGDRVQFTKTDKMASIYNSDVGTITALDAKTGEISVLVDAAGGKKREVCWNVNDFNGFRLGYAGTIYKGQGKTLDKTYLYHSRHWTSAPSYVALTRQRDSARIFVARETARDVKQLGLQMACSEVRSASIAWATRDEHAGREAHHEKQRTSFERIQARRFIRDWSQRMETFRAALPDRDRNVADYAQARDSLRDFAQPLQNQPTLAAALRQAALANPSEHATLLRMIDHPDPAQALAHIIAEAEQEQQERNMIAQTPLKDPRPRDRTQSR